MIKKYIMSRINNCVNIEPQFDKIKNLIDYEQFRTNHNKISIFCNAKLKFVSLILVASFMLVLVFFINYNSTKPVDPNSGVVVQTPSETDPVLIYSISTNKDTYLYGEEFEINVLMCQNPDKSWCVAEGDLRIKIMENECYEVIGDKEYIISNFNSSSYHGTKEEPYPIHVTFKIKPLKENFTIGLIEFGIKFSYNEKIEDIIKENFEIEPNSNQWWYDFEQEYFLIISGLFHINDAMGIVLSNNEIDLLYKSLNREFNNNYIDKKEYMNKLVDYLLIDEICIRREIKDSAVYYFSRNTKFKVQFDNENDDIYIKLSNLLQENQNIDAAKMLVDLALDNELISQELYNIEIHNIIDSTIWRKFKYSHVPYLNNQYIIFNDYKDYLFDFELII